MNVTSTSSGPVFSTFVRKPVFGLALTNSTVFWPTRINTNPPVNSNGGGSEVGGVVVLVVVGEDGAEVPVSGIEVVVTTVVVEVVVVGFPSNRGGFLIAG